MGMLDFLKVTVVEKTVVPKYNAALLIDGKQFTVSNLGVGSVTVSGGRFKVGQKVEFDLRLRDPKENLALRGAGMVSSVEKSEAKITFAGLSEAQRQAVARFLARYMITR